MAGQHSQFAVGVDIGGTNMVAAVVSGQTGQVHSRHTILTEPQRGPADGFARLGDLIDHVCREAQVEPGNLAGIGVGCTSPIDPVQGTVNNPYTLPTWEDAPLMPYLAERFGLPWVLLNDAHVAALGEHWVGAGQGTRHMLYITVGTGIGGGIIIDGRLHRGVGLLAAEVGHQVIDLHGPECYCGARGCLEMLAAGPAIVHEAAACAEANGLLLALAEGDRDRITSRLVYEAARQGDATARAILEQAGVYLGIGVGNLINVLAPEAVILGGGVMQGWDLIAPSMLRTIDSRNAMIPHEFIRIERAALGLNAGVTGAARAIFDHLAGKL
ncbi:MAG: ROK family protein [Anaerolineae bacterium]|nr:ROK family protein [Anaerolineae bacterium]